MQGAHRTDTESGVPVCPNCGGRYGEDSGVGRVRPSFIFLIRASGSCGLLPILVRPLLRALAVYLRKVLPRRRLDPRRFRQLLEPRIVPRPVVASRDRPHRHVRLLRRRIHLHRLPSKQPRLPQPFQHPPERRPVRLQAQPLVRLRQREMFRGAFARTVARNSRSEIECLHRHAMPRSRPSVSIRIVSSFGRLFPLSGG